jgi:hypothetical protein
MYIKDKDPAEWPVHPLFIQWSAVFSGQVSRRFVSISVCSLFYKLKLVVGSKVKCELRIRFAEFDLWVLC